MVGTKVKVWPFLAGGTCWGARCNQFVPSQTQVSFSADPPKSVIRFRASSYANAWPKRLAGANAGIRTFQLVPVHAQVAERFAPDLHPGAWLRQHQPPRAVPRQHQHFCSQTGCQEVSFATMSIEQVESAIREMPLEDRRKLLLWLDEHRYELFAGSDAVTEAQKTELLRRRQEYFDQPERFTRVTNEQELDRFFEDIRREVQARLPSARPA
jgi:hypothetical protein